jgi:hypothetical protein
VAVSSNGADDASRSYFSHAVISCVRDVNIPHRVYYDAFGLLQFGGNGLAAIAHLIAARNGGQLEYRGRRTQGREAG